MKVSEAHDEKIKSKQASPKFLIACPPHLQQHYQCIVDEYRHLNIVNKVASKEVLYAEISDTNALVGCPTGLITDELIQHAGKCLKWIHHAGAGVEQLMIPALIKSNITLTNGRIIQGPECADHALALLLMLTRQIHKVIKGDFNGRSHRPLELYGKQALVIGMGGIGMCIAERAAGFGMKVTGLDLDSVPMLKMLEKTIYPDELLAVLPDIDVVFMAAPHTWDTYQIFNNQAFAAMKKDSYFINVSRGATVDTDALTQAAASGRLAGVGIDVTDPEPLSDAHPLRTMENVIITPHIAGLSEHNRARSLAVIKENIQRFAYDKPLLNVVNKSLGF